MRLRFSLRTFFLFTTLVAIFCYVWFIRPTRLAERFAQAINAEDFEEAKRLFPRTATTPFAEWSEKYWGFRARCEIQPLTLLELLTARRQLYVHSSYFELDSQINRTDRFMATPRGVAPDSFVSVAASRILIDRANSAPQN